MKKIITLITIFYSAAAFGQQITLSEWDEQAKTNKRLLPKYGYQVKSEEEKNADKEFMVTALAIDTTNRKASDHLVALGFKYLYRDIKTAMYRFNQAYLLDSTNTDIYWGFGGVYLTLGDYGRAAEQYKKGLALNPNNPHLLTDYGTYFMGMYYALEPLPGSDAGKHLDSAIIYMGRSYQLNPADESTSYKLSIAYWNKGDCDNAWKYYDACKALGGQPIEENYTKDLKKKCKRKK